jgi:hypothetical protein
MPRYVGARYIVPDGIFDKAKNITPCIDYATVCMGTIYRAPTVYSTELKGLTTESRYPLINRVVTHQTPTTPVETLHVTSLQGLPINDMNYKKPGNFYETRFLVLTTSKLIKSTKAIALELPRD